MSVYNTVWRTDRFGHLRVLITMKYFNYFQLDFLWKSKVYVNDFGFGAVYFVDDVEEKGRRI